MHEMSAMESHVSAPVDSETVVGSVSSWMFVVVDMSGTVMERAWKG